MAISKILLNGVSQIDLTQDTVNAQSAIAGVTGHQNNGTTFAGGISTVAQGTPNISVNTSNGLITASVSQSAGIVAAGTTSATSQLSTVAGTTITPTESEQTAVAANKYTTGAVKVKAIPSTYVGSGISTKNSGDLAVNGATVTAPAGYYANNATKSVTTMTLPTSTSSSATSGYSSKATITRSTSDQYINIPPGYNSAGGYYKISATPNGSVTAPTSITGTGSAISTSSGTLTLTKTISVTPNVTSAGYISSGTAGNSTVTLSASMNIRSSSDLTVSGASVTAPAGYYAAAGTTAVSSGTQGTPTASKGSVSNHSISVTPSVTNTTGYISGGTKTGTAVTVSASELTSGTYSVTSSGNANVVNYSSVSVPALTLPTTTSSSSSGTLKATIGRSTSNQYLNISTGFNNTAGYYTISAVANGTAGTPTATKGSVSNHSISVTPSVTNTAGYISGGTKTGTAVTVSASELVSGSTTLTSNSTYDVTNFASVAVEVEGGGGSGGDDEGPTVATATKTLTAAANSISFTGLSGEPTSFVVVSSADIATSSSSPYRTTAVVYDGTNVIGQTLTSQVTYNGTGFSKSYSNGTLTITGTGTQFQANEYKLTYTYGGSSSDIKTSDVQVGSGATSITFTGLTDRPKYFSCIFKSDFSTSSGYQRVIVVTYDGTSTYGMEMDSSAHAASHWTYSYSGGSLTITSSGTNQGGYFHQPGYYQLTYAVGGSDGGGNYQTITKTYTPTTSQQTEQITAGIGYDAIEQVNVTVNAIPNTYVQPTSTIGSTTYRASTSNQTIQSGTYHSAAATIAAVSQTNLEAGNIKSGTTITISNGQSNIWSVTGTYTGSGGGANFGTVTMTNSSNQAQSINFTLPSGRTPKAFFARLTSQIARSSNSRYYYVFDMRWDGSSSGGVAGNQFYMYNGTLSNVTSGYSYSQNGTTFTLSSTGSRSASPGSFYNGTYELVYVY